MNLRSASFLIPAALLAGCGLVYNYGDYKDQPTGGMPSSSTSTAGAGGATSSSSTSSGTGGATSTSSTSSGATSSGSSSSTSTSGTTSSSSTSSSGNPCSSGTTCTAIPSGWSGPVSLLQSTQGVPTCTTPSAQALTGGTALTQGSCTQCTCGTATGGACPSTVTARAYGTTNCNGTPTALTLAPSICTSANQVSAIEASSQTATWSCGLGPDPALTPAHWNPYATACTGAQPLCMGGFCEASGAQACIYRTGALACPSPFTHQTVVYTAISSDLTCKSCQCDPTPPVCSATVTLYSDTTCGGSAVATGALTTCTIAAMTVGSVGLSAWTMSGGSCSPSGGGITGSATAGTPYTVCCLN